MDIHSFNWSIINYGEIIFEEDKIKGNWIFQYFPLFSFNELIKAIENKKFDDKWDCIKGFMFQKRKTNWLREDKKQSEIPKHRWNGTRGNHWDHPGYFLILCSIN